MLRRIALCALLLATPAAAQVAGVIPGGGEGPSLAVASIRVERSLSQPSNPALNTLTDVSALRPLSTAPPAAKARADALLDGAAALIGKEEFGPLRQRTAEAATLLLGREWTPDQAYARSLALDVTELVADPARPIHVRLTQLYPARTTPGLTLRLSLTTIGAPGRGPAQPAAEHEVRALWSMPLPPRDLIAANLPFDVELTGVADGNYALTATVLRDDAVLAATRVPVRLVAGLAASGAVRAALARAKPRPDLAATISYPFDTARAVNGWRRDIPENLDFPAAIARSQQLAEAAGAGRDPLWQALGDQRRAYAFEAGRETMPYRLYVPKAWKPGVKLPMVVVLHGGGGNEDGVFPADGRFAGQMQALAETHGMIVVSPLGFRPNGGYGAVYGPTAAGRPGVRPDVAASLNVPQLSEADTMAVIARVAAEYGSDPDRLYLVGNSMGGGGTWYIGGKYAAMFAAIAPCASSLTFGDYDFGRLAKVPVHAVVGAQDAELRRNLAAQAVAALQARHYDATLTVVPGENHGNAWWVALPGTFDFFAAHRRAK